MSFSLWELLNYSFKTKKVSSNINKKHDKKCKEYLNVRAELSATGQAVHGPSCPRAELSGNLLFRWR